MRETNLASVQAVVKNSIQNLYFGDIKDIVLILVLIVHERFGFSCSECYRSFRAMDVLKTHLKKTHGFTRFEMPNFELQENLKKNQSKSTGNVEEKIQLSLKKLDQKKDPNLKLIFALLKRLSFIAKYIKKKH